MSGYGAFRPGLYGYRDPNSGFDEHGPQRDHGRTDSTSQMGGRVGYSDGYETNRPQFSDSSYNERDDDQDNIHPALRRQPIPHVPSPPNQKPKSTKKKITSLSETDTPAPPQTAKRYSQHEDNFLIWAVGLGKLSETRGMAKESDIWDCISLRMHGWLKFRYPAIAAEVGIRSWRTLKEHWNRDRNTTTCLKNRWEKDERWESQLSTWKSLR
ncbi:hypothetical protein TWF506_008105 [Arthrobotrys conoides]|uniref:Myb-like domain-containing protein n=1 Tax=Arthrobotrys conoides TaxID=74498 RepID=A0AAN8RX53_9PEZI